MRCRRHRRLLHSAPLGTQHDRRQTTGDSFLFAVEIETEGNRECGRERERQMPSNKHIRFNHRIECVQCACAVYCVSCREYIAKRKKTSHVTYTDTPTWRAFWCSVVVGVTWEKMPLNYSDDGDNISMRFKERFIIIIIDVMSAAHMNMNAHTQTAFGPYGCGFLVSSICAPKKFFQPSDVHANRSENDDDDDIEQQQRLRQPQNHKFSVFNSEKKITFQ